MADEPNDPIDDLDLNAPNGADDSAAAEELTEELDESGADAGLDDEAAPGAGEPDGGTESPGAGDAAGQDARSQGQPAQVNGRRNRFADLSNRVRDLTRQREEDRRNFEAQLAAARNAPQVAEQQRQQQLEFERGLERARLEGPESVIQFYRQQDQAQQRQQFAALQLQVADNNDRAAFDALAGRVALAGELRDRVEDVLREERAKGSYPSRTAIFYHEVGRRAVERLQRQAGSLRRRAAAGVARETVRAPNARGAVPAGRERQTGEKAARDKRLENMAI